MTLAAVLCGISCEYEFEPEGLSDKGMIYIYCVPSASEPLEILAAIAYPIKSKYDFEAGDLTLTMKVNGEDISMKEDLSYVSDFIG